MRNLFHNSSNTLLIISFFFRFIVHNRHATAPRTANWLLTVNMSSHFILNSITKKIQFLLFALSKSWQWFNNRFATLYRLFAMGHDIHSVNNNLATSILIELTDTLCQFNTLLFSLVCHPDQDNSHKCSRYGSLWIKIPHAYSLF